MAAWASVSTGVRTWRHFADCRLGQMSFRTAEAADGSAIQKTPLVCLHESPLSGREFAKFQPVIATDRRVLCPDMPGYGASDGPFNQPEIDDYAGALADALTVLGYGADGTGPVDLLGFHTGTVVACALATRRPDLVRKLVLPGTPYFPAPIREQHRRRYGQPRPFHDPDYVGSTYRQLVLKVGVPADSPEPQRDGELELDRRYEMFVIRLRPGTRSHFGFEAVFRHDLDRTLTTLTQPALLPVLNEWLNEPTRQAATLIGDAKVVELPQFTKYAWDVHPARMTEVIRSFLDNSPHRSGPVAAPPKLAELGRMPPASAPINGSTQHWRAYITNRYGQMHIRSARPARPPSGNRAPVLLLHPNPVSGNAFRELLQVLGTDRTVHAPDMPGFGDSDQPGTEPAITGLAGATAEALRELGYTPMPGGQLDVFGVGMGACIATELARQSPGLVRRVVLCDVPSPARRSTYDFYADPDYVDRLYKRIVENGDARLPFQRRLEHFTDHMLTGRNGEWGERITLSYKGERGLHALAQPTLLMALDDESAESTRAAGSLISKSEYMRLNGMTGLGFITHPDAIAHAIRQFLDQ